MSRLCFMPQCIVIQNSNHLHPFSSRDRLCRIWPPSVNSIHEADKNPVVEIVETAQNSLPETMKTPPFNVGVYRFKVN
jgi:hypothetical protein